MRFTRKRYQKGGARKVARSQGFACEFRYYVTDKYGMRRGKVQTLNLLAYETEFDVRKAMGSQMSALDDGRLRGRMDATFGHLISI